MKVKISAKPGVVWNVDIFEIAVIAEGDPSRFKRFYSLEHLIRYLLESKAEVISEN